MGIKYLNNFLIENCSTAAINKISLRHLAHKTVVIDTSIYLYKFAEKNAVAENIYLLISVFLEYGITPVFIFDGKPPAEKKELLIKRKLEKDAAEVRYNELKSTLDSSGVENDAVLHEMDSLKKKFVRVSDANIRQSKEIMAAYGVPYIDSVGESDHLCAFLVKHGFAWACVSDDMDMFLYGCPRVLRHLSLLNHDAILYDTAHILTDLDMTQEVFNDIAILSGTDYNLKDSRSLSSVVRLYMEYREWVYHNRFSKMEFYSWLVDVRRYIEMDSVAAIVNARNMFDLDLYLENNRAEVKSIIDRLPFRAGEIDRVKLEEVLAEDGFIFT
jgi:hypothetical protein